MKAKTVVLFVLVSFVSLCGVLVMGAARSRKPLAVTPLAATAENNAPAATLDAAALAETDTSPAAKVQTPVVYPNLAAVSQQEENVTLGAVYPDIRRTDDAATYKFKLELTSQGAAIKTATLSEFDNRNKKAPEPLRLLSPLQGNKSFYSLANAALRVAPADAAQFGVKAFPLDRLHWAVIPSENPDTAVFEAILTDLETKAEVLRLTKTYRIEPGSYDVVCELTAENLSEAPLQVLMQMLGPGGLLREEEREDDRKVFVAFPKEETSVQTRLLSAADIRRAEQEKIRPSEGVFTQLKNMVSKPTSPEVKLQLEVGGKDTPLQWTASTNKYFAAILRPVGPTLTEPGPLHFSRAVFYDTAILSPEPDENAGAASLLETQPLLLAAAHQDGSRQTLNLELYLGPKDKSVFEANEVYRKLEYFQTIDFRGCCCPTSMIGPLAFGIMWLMKTVYTLTGPFGNYGIVIIILVFVVRLILHPITKRSQVSMMKMQKLGPRIQEIQKKYADNKQEMNRKVMEVYREMGVSPVSGMLPMFLQMPIWIALWTAVNISIDLRGQSFLPFWITDLSAPDHLFQFPFGLTLPFVGQYFNLLPILMGVFMYAQQKLMPTSQSSAQTNPQMAQQQKMMMILMPLMFPLMLYHGPSGVNLYIMSSIGAGVIEQLVIRKHIREREEMEAQGMVPVTAKTGGKLKKKKPKPMFRFDKS